MKLYTTHRMSRGKVVEWYLQELGLHEDKVELVKLRLDNKEHKQDSFLKINPFGQVPALEDGDFQLFETGAILLYLAEKFSGDVNTPQKRATLAKWILFGNTTLTDAIFNKEKRDRLAPNVFKALDQHLENRDYLENSFTAADVVVGSAFAWQDLMAPDLDLSAYPNIERYKKDVLQRPAHLEAMSQAAIMLRESLRERESKSGK